MHVIIRHPCLLVGVSSRPLCLRHLPTTTKDLELLLVTRSFVPTSRSLEEAERQRASLRRIQTLDCLCGSGALLVCFLIFTSQTTISFPLSSSSLSLLLFFEYLNLISKNNVTSSSSKLVRDVGSSNLFRRPSRHFPQEATTTFLGRKKITQGFPLRMWNFSLPNRRSNR